MVETIKKTVDRYADLMSRAERYIWNNPEVGYKEYKTNEYMIKSFEELGYTVECFDGITGFTTYFDTGRKGATVLVIAELDALYCAQHPECNKETGAVHVCGHNIQCASILGVAAAIKDITISDNLSGKVKFAVVPAEEGIELTYRNSLIEKGVISFTSGKPECISRGMLDDVDVAFMVHVTNITNVTANGGVYYFLKGSNGVIRKKTVITGVAAHAGGSPHKGINALYAAELMFAATNALRETFKESDMIRFHSIITKGGESVNAIPEEVVIESYVRGASPDAIKQANKKINRAITGACLAIGARVKIEDRAGSEALFCNDELTKVMSEAGSDLVGEDLCYVTNEWRADSTDMGDVSCIVPSVHAYVDGYRGLAHGKNYVVEDPVKVCLDSANLQVATLVKLLKNGCEKVYDIKTDFKPKYLSIEEYLKSKKALSQTVDCIEYDGNKIKINL